MLASTHCSTFCIAVMVAKDSERRSKALHTPLTRKCCHNDSRLLPVLTPFLNSPECWHSPKIIPFNSVTTNLLIQRSKLPLLLFQLHFPHHKQSTFLNASMAFYSIKALSLVYTVPLAQHIRWPHFCLHADFVLSYMLCSWD